MTLASSAVSESDGSLWRSGQHQPKVAKYSSIMRNNRRRNNHRKPEESEEKYQYISHEQYRLNEMWRKLVSDNGLQ
jgi:hypothetical protein